MWGWGGGAAWGWMVAMGVFWVLLIAGIVLAIVLVVRATMPSQGDGVGRSRAGVILEEPFAHGEIDEDEFRRKTRALGQ